MQGMDTMAQRQTGGRGIAGPVAARPCRASQRGARRPGWRAVSRFLLLLPLAALLGLAAGPTDASDRDQDRARAALEAGEVLPLATVLERVGREVPGQVLEVELERERGRWVYEVRVLQAGGRLMRLAVDAKTATVLERRLRDRREH